MANTLDDDMTSDLTYIQKVISDITTGLATYLVDENICSDSESLSTAVRLLSTDGPIEFNSDDTNSREEKANDVIHEAKKKIPRFLFVIALTCQSSTNQWDKERKRRECEAKTFLKAAFPKHAKIVQKNMKFVTVNRYEDMKTRVAEFFKAKARRSIMPFVVFLGHGDKAGKLCFGRGQSKPEAKSVLDDIKKIFHAKKAEDTPEYQCRVVFTQCFAHKIDNRDAKGKIQVNGIEYIYFTTSERQRTTSTPREIIELTQHAQNTVGDGPKNKTIGFSNLESRNPSIPTNQRFSVSMQCCH